MSTKIYNGYKLKKADNTTNILEIQRISHKIRDVIRPIQKRLYYEKFLSEMVEAYDKNQYGFWEESIYFISRETNNMYWGIDQYLRKRILFMNLKQERDPSVDFGFNFTIIPVKVKGGVEVLILLYTEHKELREAFEAIEEIEDYHYQDQSDRPKGITSSNWEKRNKHWKKALGGDGWATPAESGFSFDPTSNISMWTATDEERKNMDQHIPTLEKRAKTIATLIMGREFDEKNPVDPLPENATKEQKEKRYQDGMDRYWEFEKYMYSDIGQAERDEKIKIIKTELKSFTFKKLHDAKFIPHANIQAVLDKPTKGKPYWYEL